MEKSTPGLRYVSVINEHGFLQTEKMRGKKKDVMMAKGKLTS